MSEKTVYLKVLKRRRKCKLCGEYIEKGETAVIWTEDHPEFPYYSTCPYETTIAFHLKCHEKCFGPVEEER